MKAYVLINARAGRARGLVKKLQQVKGVKHVNACWGRPDIFAFVDVENEKVLADAVLDQIQAIDGIESTDTHIVIE